MVRRQRLVALVAVSVTVAAAVSGWSITSAPTAMATAPPGVGWGLNSSGQLGTGLAPFAASPVLVSDGERAPADDFVQVSVGASNACGVTASGKGYCWGKGASGALGDGSRDASSTPVVVAQGARLADDTFASIAVGKDFACGLTGRGKAFCWGTNMDGQLGSGNQDDSTAPVAVAGSLLFRSLNVGEANGCGVATDDSVYCWGNTRFGQMGTGSMGFTPATTPTRISGGAIPDGTRMAAVAVGSQHICAVAQSGEAYCWGNNMFGQLGNGIMGSLSVPVAVSGSRSYDAVSAGAAATCGVATDDSVYCWGANSSGQLGVGDLTTRTSPTQVVSSGVLSGQASATVSLYSETTCVQTLMGLAACWGLNNQGQVGDGTRVNANTPVAVLTGSKPPGAAWTQVSSGATATCGLSAGDAYCWGTRELGLLGDGTSTLLPTPVDMARGQMGASESFSAIDAGETSSCGVGTSGWVYCWGSGANGRLGNGGTSSYYDPQAIAAGSVPGGTTFSVVSVRRDFGCARSTAGGLYCWGSNGSGQLGNSSQTNSTVPVTVANGQKPADDTWTTVVTGLASTCAIASDDSAYCWGEDAAGQVGNGASTGPFTSPQALAIPGPWKAITVGSQHACGIAGDDSTYCWGENAYGQLGTGNYTYQNQPTLVVTTHLLAGETFTSLAAGSATTCGLTSAGRILCWGSGNAGALGDGANNASSIPVATSAPAGVPGGVIYSAVSVGDWFACGLASTGSAYCWGTNTAGQLGDGTFTNRSVPVAVSVSGSTSFTALSAGSQLVLALEVPPVPPSAPTLTSASTTQTSASVSFTPGASGTSPITNYEYSLDGGAWLAVSPLDALSPVTITGLTSGTTYSVRLRAVSDVAPGAASAPLSVTTESAPSPAPAPGPAPATPPGAPTNVVATPGDRSVTVRWAVPADLGSPAATRYEVESTPSGVTCTTSGTTCVVSGLRNGTEYAFRVRALSDSAAGAWSGWTSGVVPRGVPSSPTAVVAVAGDQSARLTWQAPTDDGGSPILGYTVRATAGEASCTVLALTCAVSGLTNGTTYTFTVVATNAVGSSLPSNPSNAVTPDSQAEPSIVITGSRADRTPRDKVAIIGVTTGLIGAEAQAWVMPQGRSRFASRGEPLLIGESQRFRWTGTIHRAAQVYFTAGDVRSNKITLPRR